MNISTQQNPVVDVHTHIAPKLTESEISQFELALNEKGQYLKKGSPMGPKDLYSPQLLLDYLDRNGVDEGFVSVPPPFYRSPMGPDTIEDWVASINLGVIEAVKFSSRLKPLLYLPLSDPAAAVKVVRANIDNDAIAGWTAAAGQDSLSVALPEFEELWNLLEADGRPLLFHPGMTPDARMQEFYLHNLLGNPVETAVTVGQLVLGGVLDRHAKLKIILVHCGGVVPSVAARWQKGIDTDRPDVTPLAQSVYETLGKMYTDCLTHDSVNVEVAAKIFGKDRLLLGSDWPFPMGLENPWDPISIFSEKDQQTIARDNPKRIYEH